MAHFGVNLLKMCGRTAWYVCKFVSTKNRWLVEVKLFPNKQVIKDSIFFCHSVPLLLMNSRRHARSKERMVRSRNRLGEMVALIEENTILPTILVRNPSRKFLWHTKLVCFLFMMIKWVWIKIHSKNARNVCCWMNSVKLWRNKKGSFKDTT